MGPRIPTEEDKARAAARVRKATPTEAPLTLRIPNTDLVLRDGRRLIYHGIREQSLSTGEVLESLLDRTKHETRPMAVWKSEPAGDNPQLIVTAFNERTPHGVLLHVAMSYSDHDPAWSEIKDIRYAFYPVFVDVMMMLPADTDFINLHEHCFHLWLTPKRWRVQ